MTSTLYPVRSFTRGTASTIPVDLYRQGDTYRLEADLPGVDPKSVDIDVDGQLLTIRAERAVTVADDARWLARGRQSGSFVRRFTLGQGIDRDAIAATYDNGVLSLSIPVSEKSRARKVEVTSAAHEVPAEGVSTDTGETPVAA